MNSATSLLKQNKTKHRCSFQSLLDLGIGDRGAGPVPMEGAPSQSEPGPDSPLSHCWQHLCEACISAGPHPRLKELPEPDLSLQVLSADHLPLLPHIPVSLCILSFSKDSPPRVHSSPCSRHLGTTQHLASLPSSKHPSPTVILASLQLPGPLETHQVLGQEPALVQPTAGA